MHRKYVFYNRSEASGLLKALETCDIWLRSMHFAMHLKVLLSQGITQKLKHARKYMFYLIFQVSGLPEALKSHDIC
jgi:hypothetical protein